MTLKIIFFMIYCIILYSIYVKYLSNLMMYILLYYVTLCYDVCTHYCTYDVCNIMYYASLPLPYAVPDVFVNYGICSYRREEVLK